ncbi:hypothetical protein Lalb_Chr14g0365481 [Lupinus albus]|uniref:Uncharacterized protein n=1 Tax=Lupinus albus TaxID=3870 RepID=A0A6A4PCD8_LUPAL|nr:hypothetical protein Lalb_Chr14g0365481 [Lupinus albus]
MYTNNWMSYVHSEVTQIITLLLEMRPFMHLDRVSVTAATMSLLNSFFKSGVSKVTYFVEERLENSDMAYFASHKVLLWAGVKVRSYSKFSQD